MYENEPIITIKDLIIDDNYLAKTIAKRYINLIDNCFNHNFKQKSMLVNTFINNDRTILDRYLKNDYALLKQKILNTRKQCYNRKEIERDVNTLDFQIKLLNECKNHREFLYKNLELNMSEDRKKRREYNLDIYFDIVDYFCEKIIDEQEEYYYRYEVISKQQ